MLKDANDKILVRDIKTLARIKTINRSTRILRSFFDKGFKSFEALQSIVNHYYPEIGYKRLWDFWHFRKFDQSINDSLEDVFNKLNKE